MDMQVTAAGRRGSLTSFLLREDRGSRWFLLALALIGLGLPEGHRLFHADHTHLRAAPSFQQLGDLDIAVTVGIALYHGAEKRIFRQKLAEQMKVVLQ